ncbi:MAG: hypothetical protein NTY20_06230, partial [Candidatus Aenigmarchaeota archaeon]|nr:hypothetical protein [Candidatus Aenigmarchaeota archaeon]
SLIVQGLMSSDIHSFGMYVYDTTKKNGLSFEEDFEPLENLDGPFSYTGVGYWGRWVKKNE